MRLMVFAMAALMASPSMADDILIDVENFTAERGVSELVLKVTNLTDSDFQFVTIDCAFLDSDMRAIDIGKSLVRNLPAGDFVYDKASIPTTVGVEHASCRVVSTR